MSALRFLAAALQRLVDRMDPQEGRYRMLFEHSPLPMWVVEARTLRFLGVNEAAMRLYGYTREEFLSMTADDVRAPVRHIDGFVKLLEREHPPASDKAAHYLRTIAASSRRMAALIDDLLALSRTGRAPLEMRTVQLGALVDEVIVDLRPDVARRRIEWSVGELPAVRGDPSLLRVVLQNLLDNA